MKEFVCGAQAEKKAEKAAAAAAVATADMMDPTASVQPVTAATPVPKAADTAAVAPAVSRLASSIAKPGNTASPTAASRLEPRLSGGTREAGREGSDPPPAPPSRQPALASSASRQVPSRIADGSRDADDSAVRLGRGGEHLGFKARQRGLAYTVDLAVIPELPHILWTTICSQLDVLFQGSLLLAFGFLKWLSQHFPHRAQMHCFGHNMTIAGQRKDCCYALHTTCHLSADRRDGSGERNTAAGSSSAAEVWSELCNVAACLNQHLTCWTLCFVSDASGLMT